MIISMVKMSVNPKVTEEDMDNLRKLAEQHKHQRAFENKDRLLKQTHDI